MMPVDSTSPCSADAPHARRRSFLGSLLGASVATTLGALLPAGLRTAHAQALTREQRDQLSPQQVLEMLKRGNERFRTGQMHPHDYLAQCIEEELLGFDRNRPRFDL